MNAAAFFALPAEHALYWLWGVWYASWILSLFWAGKPSTRLAPQSHIFYQVVTMLGIAALFGPPTAHVAPYKLWQVSEQTGWILFWLTAAAFAFCWWARLTMGKLWSGFVARNADHRVVDTGPFAIVRHPIYTGVIAAAALLAVDLGTAPAVAGAILFALAFWLKARIEENFLIRELGPAAYGAYRRRVPMLVPLGPKSR